MEFGPSHVLDRVDDVLPSHGIYRFAPPETAQQVGLVFSPVQDITVVKIGRHAPDIAPQLDKPPAKVAA
jgi:hypothetical protein